MTSKYKPLADMVAPSIKDWKGVGENAKVSFQQRMPKEYNHKKYSKGYREAKTSGKIMRRKDLKGNSQESFSATPNLTLTGKMLQKINATSTGTSAKLEFQHGDKVDALDRQGKYPMFKGQDPASKDVDKDIEKYVNAMYGKRVKKQSQKIVYKI